MGPTSVRLFSAREEGLQPGLELAAALYLPAERNSDPAWRPAPGLVVGHGAGSRAARHEVFCLEACRQGFAVLALDFRGHGDSQGKADGPLEQDIVAAARFLREHPAVDSRYVCYRGSSMGGFYGLKAAPLAGFTAMVLICPVSESVMLDSLQEKARDDDLGDTEAPDDLESGSGADVGSTVDAGSGARSAGDTRGADTHWDRPGLRAYFLHQDSRVLAAQASCPVLLVHARPDGQVPIAHSLLLAQHLRTDTTLLALEYGGHTSAQHEPAIHNYSLAWLRDRIKVAATQE